MKGPISQSRVMMARPKQETLVTRIATPTTIDAAPAAAKPLLGAVNTQLG